MSSRLENTGPFCLWCSVFPTLEIVVIRSSSTARISPDDFNDAALPINAKNRDADFVLPLADCVPPRAMLREVWDYGVPEWDIDSRDLSQG